MENNFLEAMATRASEEKYKEFVKKNGRPTHLTEEMILVGLQHFVPFFNSRCARDICIYDLGQIETLYSQKYDVSDEFKHDGDLECHYCDEVILFDDFYTSQVLTDEVEELFHKFTASKIANDARGVGTPSAKRKKPQNGEASSPKKTILSLLPNIESKTDVAKFMGGFLSRQVKRKSGQIIDSSAMKLKLMNYEVPDFRVKSTARAAQFADDVVRLKGAPLRQTHLEHFCLGELLETMPSAFDLQDFFTGRLTPLSVQSLLLAYWRVRLCKEKGRLLSVWMYDVTRRFEQPYLRLCEPLAIDSRVIYSGQPVETPYLNLIFRIDKQYHLVELNTAAGELVYINFISSKDSNSLTSADVSRISDAAFHYFEKVNKDFLNDDLDIHSRRIENVRVDCPKQFAFNHFVMDKYFSADVKLLSQVETVVHQVIMDLKVLVRNEDRPELSISVLNSERDEIAKSTKGPLMSPVNSSAGQSLKSRAGSSQQIETQAKSTRYLAVHHPRASSISKEPSVAYSHSSFKRKIDEETKKDSFQIGQKGSKVPERKDKRVIHIKRPSLTSTLQLEDSLTLPKPAVVKPDSPPVKKPPQLKSAKPQKLFAAPVKPRAEAIIKVSKNNKIPDAALSSYESREQPAEDKHQIEDIKKLLNFYFAHDRSRYKYLVSKCQSNFGAAFLQNINLSGKSKLSISRDELLGNERKLRFKDGSKLNRRESIDSNGVLETQESPGKALKIRHKPTGSLDSQWYMGNSLPKLAPAPPSTLQRKNSIFRKGSSEMNNPAKSLSEPKPATLGSNLVLEPGKEVREAHFNAALQLLDKQSSDGKTPSPPNTFVLPTNFFGELVEDMNQEIFAIRHKRVLHFTQAYSSGGSTVFDKFKRVVIPIVQEVEGVACYAAIVVESKGLEVKMFDPIANKNRQKLTKNYTRSIVKYISKEVELRTKESLDKKLIKVSELPSPRDKSTIESGNWVLFFAGRLLGGNYPLSYSKDDKDKFLKEITAKV